MMLYTEDFKKQVVRKILSPGIRPADVARKLGISLSSIKHWKIRYREEMQKEVQEIDIEALLYEPAVDVEELLLRVEREELTQTSGSDSLAQQIDQIKRKGKNASQYTDADKFAVVMSLRSMPTEQQGIWLRQLGVQGPHIRLWEDQLITMSKKPIQTDQYTKQLEDENRLLKKQLTEAERDNRELKILIELKKKYPSLFHQDEDKS
jgi:transposase-like protein